jgi:hypothetical protein
MPIGIVDHKPEMTPDELEYVQDAIALWCDYLQVEPVVFIGRLRDKSGFGVVNIRKKHATHEETIVLLTEIIEFMCHAYSESQV